MPRLSIGVQLCSRSGVRSAGLGGQSDCQHIGRQGSKHVTQRNRFCWPRLKGLEMLSENGMSRDTPSFAETRSSMRRTSDSSLTPSASTPFGDSLRRPCCRRFCAGNGRACGTTSAPCEARADQNLRPCRSLQGIFLQPIRTWARMVRLRKVRAGKVNRIAGACMGSKPECPSGPLTNKGAVAMRRVSPEPRLSSSDGQGHGLM